MKPSLIFLIDAGVGTAILLTACHSRRTYYQGPPIDGFRFGAHATIVGTRADTLRLDATAENVSHHELREERGACYQQLALVAKKGPKSWDSQIWEIRRLPVYHDANRREVHMACSGVVLITVPPGGLLTYELRVPIKEILGDSLAPGKYRVIARLSINGREVKNLEAGEVEFSPPPT